MLACIQIEAWLLLSVFRERGLIDTYRFSGLYVFENRFFMGIRSGLYLSRDLEDIFELFFD